jgi:phosphopantetheine adenylyltransferase
MVSIGRKIRRKKQKSVFKEFKKRMKDLKRFVKCSKCDKVPQQGEKIDDWYMEKDPSEIILVCPECGNEAKDASNE